MDKYVKGQLLGKGSYGSAYLVTHKADGRHYVLKETPVMRMPAVEREAAKQEAEVHCDRVWQAEYWCRQRGFGGTVTDSASRHANDFVCSC
jgi:serine/threonine protein kinase